MARILLFRGEIDLDCIERYWDTDLHALDIVDATSNPTCTPTVQLAAGTVVDLYNVGTTLTEVLSDGNAGVTQNTIPGRIFLKQTAGAGSADSVRVFYETNTKDLITETFANTEPSWAFSKPILDLIETYCLGTTQREVYHDGEGGLNFVDTPLSSSCGANPPLENTVLTETKVIELRACTFENPVYLCWKNTLGGWDFWLFHTHQRVQLKTKSLGDALVPLNDPQYATTERRSLGKTAEREIRIGAEGLTRDQIDGLAELLHSPKVLRHLGGDDWEEVQVQDGSFTLYETDRGLHDLELEISLQMTQTLAA